MKTVWLLISPVLLLMNSAVTNSGAAYVWSLSLHSSTGALTSSKRGSEKLSDSVPAKSSIGDSSASTSSRPPTGFDVAALERLFTPAVGADQPLERVGLNVEQPRNLERLTELGEGNSVRCSRNGVVGDILTLLWRETAKMHPSSTSCDDRMPGEGRTRTPRYLRRFGWLSPVRITDTRHATRSLSRAQARTTVSGAGEVGRRQPAQRPTIAQDGAFLNKPITAMC